VRQAAAWDEPAPGRCDAARDGRADRQVQDVISRTPGRRGTTVLRTLLDQRTGSTVSRSQGEERMLALIRLAGFRPRR